MGKLFGTDGVRGIANEDLTCELACEIAKAAGTIIREEKGRRCRFLLGTDTRGSAPMLSAAICAAPWAATSPSWAWYPPRRWPT